MTDEDLRQHAAAWQSAAEAFAHDEERWSGSSLQAEASAHRRLCMAIAQATVNRSEGRRLRR